MASSFSAPWPNPNSHVLSKIDFGVPLAELLKWLDIRDIFTGENRKTQDIAKALALAHGCNQPDAVWLTSIFDGKDVSTKEEAREVLLLYQNDARALFFVWILSENRWRDWTMLQCSAKMGNVFACSMLCDFLVRESAEKTFRAAQFAAAQFEREGFYYLGRCLELGVGCKKDFSLAKENYLIAGELGHIDAAGYYATLLDTFDFSRWLWFGRIAVRGSPFLFLGSFSKRVKEFFSGSGNATVVFVIGRALKGHIDIETNTIFGSEFKFDSCIGPAVQAISFYESQMHSARLAVKTWTLVATRLYLIKDMRILVGKMIWEGRFEANYKI